ncbi:unnamed protein product [Symbiodinium sp. CCMP2592]|nr:unnamed protein product [Symbiodinium sp. CCMP2592]
MAEASLQPELSRSQRKKLAAKARKARYLAAQVADDEDEGVPAAQEVEDLSRKGVEQPEEEEHAGAIQNSVMPTTSISSIQGSHSLEDLKKAVCDELYQIQCRFRIMEIVLGHVLEENQELKRRLHEEEPNGADAEDQVF